MGLLIELQPEFGRALVVGGGPIAARKVRTLVESKFETVVIAPDIADEIRGRPWVTVQQRPFEDADLEYFAPVAVVFACTNDRDLNQRIGQMCHRSRIPVVVADAAEESTFFTPAVLRNGEIAIAVSTGGTSPSTAKLIRERIAVALAPSLASIQQMRAADAEQRKPREIGDEKDRPRDEIVMDVSGRMARLLRRDEGDP